MPGEFRVEEADPADFPALAAIVATCFQSMPVEALTTGPPTPSNLSALAARYLHAHHLHQAHATVPAFLKCVYTDPTTRAQTIVATAQWYIYPRQRTAEEVSTPHYLLSCAWMPDGPDKAKATAFYAPFLAARRRWMRARPHGVLMYLAVLPAWRQRGAASLCVQWGLERCDALGVPAYLEASEAGVPVYEKLGFEAVEVVEFEWEGKGGRCPVMIRGAGGSGWEGDGEGREGALGEADG
ncbi:acyl-CoA N-acyltransferase [Boeremia exigua]|uniref:acyl-CoA N-acyltransferase n=1 Tax=Boeremia exigua TaxID=749465 RepID=UPI001E8DA024|nr:acyl-CoA N-acyltransferase [Boeremia exigua]KAH6625730.1 acyl-CoA N-acyltransferase [Boeremia exigua]